MHGQEDAKSFSYGLVGLKGYLFKLLSQDIIASNGKLLEDIYQNPALVMETLAKYRKKEEPVAMQMNLFGESEPMGQKKKPAKKASAKKIIDFYVPDSELAANYSPHIKYFIPEWDDRVDPDYDFISDQAVEGRDPYSHDVYAHEIYPTPNYDGVLISKCMLSTKSGNAIIKSVPLSRVLPETDAPFVEKNGAPYMPWDATVINQLATMYGIPVKEMERTMLFNLQSLHGKHLV